MMKILLSHYGFKNVQQRELCESSCPEFTEPLHVVGLEPVWQNLNNDLYEKHNLIRRYAAGTYEINFTVTGFDGIH